MFNQNTDRNTPQEKFTGFYRGVVKNTNDQKKNGRIQIKVYPMFEGVEDIDLPWAIYADTGMGGTRDVGKLVVPEVGSHVFVFFENGDHRFPVYFAGAPAIEDDIPDTPKLAREDDGTHAAIDAARRTGIATAGGGTWDEPTSSYNPSYPNNKVLKTKQGIIVELDDTQDNVRFHVYHPSGTREEIDNAGNKVEHNANNKFTIVVGDDNIKIEGAMQLHVVGNADVKVVGDMNATVDGNTTIDTTEAKIVADSAKVESENVELDSEGVLGGVVTINHVCAFTGNPHPQGSLTVKSGG